MRIFKGMSSRWTWACVLGCAGMAGLTTVAAAEDSTTADANPYSVISDRNVFHLNPPPPPPKTDEAPPAEERKLILTGLMKKHNAERDAVEVFLAIPPKDGKESMIYLTLAPGDKEHDVELVRVRFDKEEVDVINAGIPETLSVKSNSYASAVPSATHIGAGGAPPMPGVPGFGHRGGLPGRSALPIPGRPSAEAGASGGSAIIAGGGASSGSAIVAGGGEGPASSAYGRGALVSGGSPYVPPGNNVGEQIANSLFNPQTGRYQAATPAAPTAPPAPPEVQAATMLLHEAAGGPPAPPIPGGGAPGIP